MSYEAIAIFMFLSMLLMMLTGQRVFAAIGIVSTGSKCRSTQLSNCSTGTRC
jgi:hypothetical protein